MLVKLGAAVLAGFLGLTTAGGIALFRDGVATVYVKNDDIWLWLPIPLAAADIALRLLPDSERTGLRRELEPVWPVAEAVLMELGNCPDVVLVEVRNPREEVSVVKKGGDVVIDVASRRGENIRVKVPLRALNRILATLAG